MNFAEAGKIVRLRTATTVSLCSGANKSKPKMTGGNKKVYRKQTGSGEGITDRFQGELSVSDQCETPAASAEQLHKRDVSRAAGASRVLGSCRTDKTLLRRRRRRVVMHSFHLTTADYPHLRPGSASHEHSDPYI